MAAYRLLAGQTTDPLHVGVTEAGGNRIGPHASPVWASAVC